MIKQNEVKFDVKFDEDGIVHEAIPHIVLKDFTSSNIKETILDESKEIIDIKFDTSSLGCDDLCAEDLRETLSILKRRMMILRLIESEFNDNFLEFYLSNGKVLFKISKNNTSFFEFTIRFQVNNQIWG